MLKSWVKYRTWQMENVERNERLCELCSRINI